MTLTIELSDEQAAGLTAKAAQSGSPLSEFVHEIIRREAESSSDPFSALSQAEQEGWVATETNDRLAMRRLSIERIRARRLKNPDASDVDIRALIDEGRRS